MKIKIQKNNKLLSGSWNYSWLHYIFNVCACCFFLVLITSPIYAQKDSEQIEYLRTKIKDALIKDVFVLSTTVVESSDDFPKHLVVRGYTMPANHFLLRLPIDEWNEKSLVSGCGLGCGELPMTVSGETRRALPKGYATAFMNTGHWSPNRADFSWAYNNLEAEKDYAYRAIHATHRALEEIIKVFYGQESTYSFFWGCSGGGRQAVMSAARYPKDFDGIIAESPVIDFTGEVMLLVWLRQTNTGPDGKDIITKEDLPLIEQVVYAVCDKNDGKVDGLISDSKPCNFNPDVFICSTGNSKDCLSREKVEVLKKWYQGPVNSEGKKLFVSGVSIGSEPFWRLWLLGKTNEPFDELINSESMLQYISFKEDMGEEYSVFDFDFNTDPDRMNYMGDLLNADRLSLKSFKEQGGKLLMYHGLADPAVPYQLSQNYYTNNRREFGEEIDDFFRLFLVPGMDHCADIPVLGINKKSIDPISLLEDWVEENNPPTELPVIQYNNNGTVKSKFSVPMYVKEK